MLCLAPIELMTEAERRLYRALSGLGPGTGVLGGLVVFIPVVEGAMQRRQADAVAFLPETVVVVRALGMGRQGGELKPSASGSWTVGGDILRLSGGGSSPAVQLHKAVELLYAALDSGGIDPGSPAALAAIDGAITSVRDRTAGGPIACSMDAGDVLTGLRHCANVGSQGDTRVWTTADVKAALTIFGLQGRGPSVEELNNEGFLYSPYVLRRRQSAVGAHLERAPALSLLSGPLAPPRSAEPVWAEPEWAEPVTDGAARPEPGWDDDKARPEPPTPPAVVEPELPTPPTTVQPEPVAEPPEDSGVGGLFTEPPDRETDDHPAEQRTPPYEPKRPPRRAAVLGLVVLVLLAALAVLLYVLTNASGGDEPAAPGTEAAGSSGSASASASASGQTSSAGTPSALPTQDIAGSTYTQQALRSDTECASNAYGQVADFFATTPCSGLTRVLFTTTVDDVPAVVSVSVVVMPDEARAVDLRDLVDASGTGNVSDLLRAGVQIDGGPSELVAAVYASELSGADVRIVEVAWMDTETERDDGLLDAVAADALLLDVMAG